MNAETTIEFAHVRSIDCHNKQEKRTKINPVSNKQAMHAGFAPVVYNPTKTGCLLVVLDKSNKQLDLQDRKFMTVSPFWLGCIPQGRTQHALPAYY
jgi:hypothetical protein